MPAPSSESAPLPRDEGASLRRDLAYAQVVIEQARKELDARERRPASHLARAGKLLTNGFVLLVLGALLTNWLIPRIQRASQAREATLQARKDALAQFLLYANSRWQEYYLLAPLVSSEELTPADYQDAIRKLTTIKLARYDAYAKLKASLLAFRRTPDEPNQEVEGLVERYAIDVNRLSQHVDSWLRNRYCWSNECISTDGAPVDRDFGPYGAFVTIQRETSALLQRDDQVAELLAKHLLDP